VPADARESVRPGGLVSRSVAVEVVAHHLRLFGLHVPSSQDGATAGRVDFVEGRSAGAADAARALAQRGDVVVALDPTPRFCASLGVDRTAVDTAPPFHLVAAGDTRAGSPRLRTLHPAGRLAHPAGVPVIVDGSGATVWLWLPVGAGGILLVGTDLAGDLVRYRQGDPERAQARPAGPRWGYAVERPNYLFEAQIEGEPRDARHADWWAHTLAHEVAKRLGQALPALLPGGAPGAVVITGDDDQAWLEKYAAQLALLAGIPVTYFLHPLTRHTRKTLSRMAAAHRRLDLGLHPDALDAPPEYPRLLGEQVAWFRGVTGETPLSVRNHGFLNDGYWGHARPWIAHGVRASSNLPGVDGHVVNGSLLPARIALDGALTPHWSILTAIGDGVRFALGMDEAQSAACIHALAQSIVRDGLPGVIVLNLHPQNVDETRAMHGAAAELVRGGFHAWTLRECLGWFAARDGEPAPPPGLAPTLGDRLRGWFSPGGGICLTTRSTA